MTNKLLMIKNLKNAKKIIQNFLRIIYQIVMKVKLESQEIFLSASGIFMFSSLSKTQTTSTVIRYNSPVLVILLLTLIKAAS